jgi:hypothetical protein
VWTIAVQQWWPANHPAGRPTAHDPAASKTGGLIAAAGIARHPTGRDPLSVKKLAKRCDVKGRCWADPKRLAATRSGQRMTPQGRELPL